MFGALKPGFRSWATLKLVVNVVGELYTEKNSCGIIARFPCDSTAFLLSVTVISPGKPESAYYNINASIQTVGGSDHFTDVTKAVRH